MNIFYKIKNVLIVFSHILKGFIFTHRWYPKLDLKYNRTAVAVIDGRLYTGGMTDRFIGIVSLYAWARSKNIPFRIHYISPFNLSEYLKPNTYDWFIKEGDYVQSSKSSIVVYAVGEPRVDCRLNRINPQKQIHFYGNRDLLVTPNFKDLEWGSLFKELFKPTDNLQFKINSFINDIGGNYFSVVLRFQNLLGDFYEYDIPSLATSQEMNEYIEVCCNGVLNLLKKEGRQCLVTSDSVTFLNKVAEFPNIHIIPGDLVHMGATNNGTYAQYEKSFLDFFILAGSTKIYNLVYKNMYPSGFPLYAARLNSVQFERIIL